MLVTWLFCGTVPRKNACDPGRGGTRRGANRRQGPPKEVSWTQWPDWALEEEFSPPQAPQRKLLQAQRCRREAQWEGGR